MYVSRIEDAEPSLEEYGQDNMGANWGHHQLTAGGLTYTNVLVSWDSVGSLTHIARLIAAILKTCRVARLLCRELNPQPSFIADIYLKNIVEHLWELMQTRKKVYHQFYIILNLELTFSP